MAVKMISVKCPECGAALNIEEGRNQAFCTYCGSKVLLHNENEYIYRHIDEAGVKKAETDRIVQMKRLELTEKKMAEAKRIKSLKIRVSLIAGIVGFLMIVFGYLAGDASGDSDSALYMVSMIGLIMIMVPAFIMTSSNDKNVNDDADYIEKAVVPSSIADYEKKSYREVEAILAGAGFINIVSIPLNDLKVGFLKKPEAVESITIDGKKITSGGKKYPKDAAVVISYHSRIS